jgi:hypothetical protein
MGQFASLIGSTYVTELSPLGSVIRLMNNRLECVKTNKPYVLDPAYIYRELYIRTLDHPLLYYMYSLKFGDV